MDLNQINSNLNNNENTQLETQQITRKIADNAMKRGVALKLVQHLESSDNRSKLIKELSTEFNDSDFYKNLDTNPNIIHCKNGVFDLDECIFRQGMPEDKISRSSNNVYISDEERETIRYMWNKKKISKTFLIKFYQILK